MRLMRRVSLQRERKNDKIALEGSFETASWVKNTCIILFKGFLLPSISSVCAVWDLFLWLARHAAKLESLLLLFLVNYSCNCMSSLCKYFHNLNDISYLLLRLNHTQFASLLWIIAHLTKTKTTLRVMYSSIFLWRY